MAQVKLIKMWFGPGGTRYRPGVHEFSEDLLSLLPTGAVVIEEPKPEPAKLEKK